MCASLVVTSSLLTGSVTPIRVSHFRGAVHERVTVKHEKKRKRRHADVGHRIDALALPLVRKSGAGVLEAAQKPVENQHPDLESENGRREHQKNRQPQRPFRIAGRAAKRRISSISYSTLPLTG